jgi:GNAT superfamily N-acetyltransferase
MMSDAKSADLPAGKMRTVITHLAMTAPSAGPLPAPPAPGITFALRRDMPREEYLTLYRAIGDDWLWWGRLVYGEAEQAAILASPETEIYLTEDNGEPVGLAEFDRRPTPDIELRYFGVVPSRIGSGLGSYLLPHALAAAWRHKPRSVILNTCDYDHPGAIGFYEKHGFAATHTETQVFDDPRLIGVLPRDVAPHIPLADGSN